MNNFSMNMVFGLILILAGISIILKHVFNIDLPIFKVLLALFLLVIGFKMLVGVFNPSTKKHSDVIFDNKKIEITESENQNYSITFGSAEIDLSKLEITEKKTELKINVTFGSAAIKINQATPIKIVSSTNFGKTILPGNVGSTVFGNDTYKSDNYDKEKPHIIIKLNVSFGEANVI